MGQQLASKIEADFKKHVEASATWARIEHGGGFTASEAGALIATLSGGLLAGLRTLARNIPDPDETA